MVLVSRAIDQDVNLFDGAELQATSERDLFASRLLPTRTPADVYRRIVLDRLPTYRRRARRSADRAIWSPPRRSAPADAKASSPCRRRCGSQEIERQIDELDRRVLSAAVLFVLLGGGLGYWMAERIADPVNRLTRATRRIARGDLDARIAATSSDELRRLVEDFNQMAADLKRQRAELERTQRLEAWADMARQVAHDIKNPLTPIQLSAEHARRVNIDRGRPLSPVLDDCVTAILVAGEAAAADLRRSSRASPRRRRRAPSRRTSARSSRRSSSRTARRSPAGSPSTCRARDNLPPISIDRTLFARALTNVIENALHAMPGGGRLTIATRLEPAAAGSGSVVVSITDTGVGMDPEDIARIFEPYFSTKATGTGLGLTIAKRNVELNGGTIAVTSQRGGGTTVVVKLPL